MGFSDTEKDLIQAQVDRIEGWIKWLTQALGNSPSSREIRQLTLIRHQDITDLQTRVTALEAQLTTIQTALDQVLPTT